MRLSTLLVAAVCLLCMSLESRAEDAPALKLPPAGEMNPAETKLAEQLTDSTLAGSFTIDGQDGPLKKDRYSIRKAYKLKNGMWLIQSRIVYGDHDITVPVVVNMDWAGKTPVLSIRDLSIPLLGDDFGACIVFDSDRYAGTWSHGKVGGHMFGNIERTPADADAGSPDKAVEKK